MSSIDEAKQEEGYKGFVLKKSKFLGSVRKRLLVLDGDTLKSFKDEDSDKPTETIQLSQACTATADLKGNGCFTLQLGSSGNERFFTCDSDDSAVQWVSMINEAARYAGLQGEIFKKNGDIDRLKKELQSLEKTLVEQAGVMEKQKTLHKERIEELLTVHGQEIERLNPNVKKTVSGDDEITIGDWVSARVIQANKIETVCVGIIQYIGNGPKKNGPILYGFETTDGTVGPHDGVVDAIRYFQCPKGTGMFITREQIMRKEVIYQVGDTIELDNKRTATLRYVGRMKSRQIDKSPAYRFGIELIGAADGNHDGKVGLTRYFKCPKRRGLMIPRTRILRLIQRGRDKAFSTVVDDEKESLHPSALISLNRLRKDMVKLGRTIILPSSRAMLATAFKHLDQVHQALKEHPVTGVPNEIAFQDDLEELLNKLVVSKNALGISVFQLAYSFESMSARDAEFTLRKLAGALEDALNQVATRETSNTKLANEMLEIMNQQRKTNSMDRVAPGRIRNEALRLYHFSDFTHRFYIIKQHPGDRFYEEMNNLVTQVEENSKIRMVSGACFLKDGETGDSLVARCLKKLDKAHKNLLKVEEVSTVL